MNEILDQYIKDNSLSLSPNTLDQYGKGVKYFFNYLNKPLKEVKRKDILNWLIFLTDEKKKPKTIRLRLTAIKSFFQYCVEEGFIKINPATEIEPPELEETLPKAIDPKSMLKIKEASQNNVRDRAIIETLHRSGVRVGELMHIKINNIDFENKQIWIEHSKGTNERFVLINHECKERINEYLRTRNDDNPYLFTNRFGKQYTKYGMQKMIKKYVKLAEVDPKISVHSFRHTFATELAEKGAKNDVIRYLLGHKDPNSVRIYTKLTEAVKKQKYDEYHNK